MSAVSPTETFEETVREMYKVPELEPAGSSGWKFRDSLWVYPSRSGCSVYVCPDGPPQDRKGGMLLVESADTGEIYDWLATKYELYH